MALEDRPHRFVSAIKSACRRRAPREDGVEGAAGRSKQQEENSEPGRCLKGEATSTDGLHSPGCPIQSHDITYSYRQRASNHPFPARSTASYAKCGKQRALPTLRTASTAAEKIRRGSIPSRAAGFAFKGNRPQAAGNQGNRQTCKACHGARGLRGAGLPPAAAPENTPARRADEGYLRQALKAFSQYRRSEHYGGPIKIARCGFL